MAGHFAGFMNLDKPVAKLPEEFIPPRQDRNRADGVALEAKSRLKIERNRGGRVQHLW